MYNVDHSIVVDQSATSNKTLLLKPIVSQTTDTIIGGRDITCAVMEKTTFQQNGPLVTGRLLHEQAILSLRNMKKALFFAMPKLKTMIENRAANNSGNVIEDVYKHVLDEIYKLLKGGEAVEDEATDDAATEENAESIETTTGGNATTITGNSTGDSCGHPDGWFFPGWMAFYLFGPLDISAYRVNILELSDPKYGENKSHGQAAARAAEAEEKDKERGAAGGNERGTSSLTVREQLGLATLALNQE
jgi:hypothetical protein